MENNLAILKRISDDLFRYDMNHLKSGACITDKEEIELLRDIHQQLTDIYNLYVEEK